MQRRLRREPIYSSSFAITTTLAIPRGTRTINSSRSSGCGGKSLSCIPFYLTFRLVQVEVRPKTRWVNMSKSIQDRERRQPYNSCAYGGDQESQEFSVSAYDPDFRTTIHSMSIGYTLAP